MVAHGNIFLQLGDTVTVVGTEDGVKQFIEVVGNSRWILMGITITMVPILIVGIVAKKVFRKTYFEICGLLAGACTDPPALAFSLKMAGSDIL